MKNYLIGFPIRMLSAHPIWRGLCLLLAYCLVILGAQILAFEIRFEFEIPPEQLRLFWRTLLWLLPLQLLALWALGQFKTLLSYFSLPDVLRIVAACATTTMISLVVWYATGGSNAAPRSIILMTFFLGAGALISVRVLFRLAREHFREGKGKLVPMRRIAIIGAGDVGAELAKDMRLRRGLRMQPVAFYDDDVSKWKTQVHGVPVIGAPELLRDGAIHVDEAVIAMPRASGKRIREVVKLLADAEIKSEIVPSMEQLVNGSVKVSQIRPVEIEDLLGREPVTLETDKIRDLVRGKVVFVTGAGGSIGSELCRQLASYSPQRLVLIERCEVQMFQIEQDLLERGHGAMIVPLVIDVLDEHRLREIFARFRPALVFHAAAHKHVPMMEHQPYEALRNNTRGTSIVAQMAGEFAAERFVLISTDKAINPTNVMGASKRLAELFVQALQKKNGTNTKFMAVRFGNVLGSSGSVIPIFRRQIAAGGPVTVTHPDVTRYFMTIPEAVGLVLQSATQGQGGEIFVLDMGAPVKITDVAKQLIELSGLRAGEDIEIEFTGLRAGEKMFEELNYGSENMAPTTHPKVMCLIGVPGELDRFAAAFAELEEKARVLEPDQVKLEMQKLVPEYRPYLNVR